MKVYNRYLSELCSNALARQHGQDSVEFVICAKGANAFPTEKRCQQFQFEDGVAE